MRGTPPAASPDPQGKVGGEACGAAPTPRDGSCRKGEAPRAGIALGSAGRAAAGAGQGRDGRGEARREAPAGRGRG